MVLGFSNFFTNYKCKITPHLVSGRKGEKEACVLRRRDERNEKHLHCAAKQTNTKRKEKTHGIQVFVVLCDRIL